MRLMVASAVGKPRAQSRGRDRQSDVGLRGVGFRV